MGTLSNSPFFIVCYKLSHVVEILALFKAIEYIATNARSKMEYFMDFKKKLSYFYKRCKEDTTFSAGTIGYWTFAICSKVGNEANDCDCEHRREHRRKEAE